MKTSNTFGLLMACSALCLLVVIACQKEVSNASDKNKPFSQSPLKIYLTDHDTPIFDSVFIDIQKLEVKLEDDTLPNGGWIKLTINAGVYNILRFRNGLDTLFGTGNLPNDRIRKVRMTLGNQNSVMRNGQSFPLKIKD